MTPTQLFPSCAPGTPLLERFLSKVIRIPESTCWHWGAAIDRDGYGVMKTSPRMQKAHRIAYELFRDVIPSGMTIDHLCRQKDCVNPAHMEVVTAIENASRVPRKPKQIKPIPAKCRNGHVYNDATIRFDSKRGALFCRRCLSNSALKWMRSKGIR